MRLAVIGLLLGFGSSFGTAISYIVMKIGLQRAQEKGISPLKDKIWWLG